MFQDECKSEREGKATKLFNLLCFRMSVRVREKAKQNNYSIYDDSE